MTQTAPAGWYPNPENPTQQRYWDGAAWTDNVAPMAPPQPVVQPPRAPAPAPTSTQAGAKGAVESVLDFVEDRRKRIEDEKRQKEEADEAAAKARKVAAKAQEERQRIQNEKIARFVGRHWKVLLPTFVALVLIISIGLWIQPKDQAEANTAAMPESAAALKGGNYQDVKTKLQTAGFTSIETSAMPDLVVGWLKKDGEVEEVSVNGGTDFGAGSRYPRNATIVIRYHTFPETESDKAAESSPAPEPDKAASSPVPEEPTPQAKPKSDLAKRTKKALLGAFGVKSFTKLIGAGGMEGSLIPFISGIEVVGAGDTVKVTVQTNNVTDGELEDTARVIHSLAGEKVKDLNRVEVWTANGEQYGASNRWEVPMLNQ